MFRKILVATDFSKSSLAALFAAISLAERGAGKVEIIHVSTLREYPYRATPFVVQTSSLLADLRGQLEEFCPRQVHPHIEKHVIIGASVSDRIKTFAFENLFDLIVLGSHGKGAVGRLVLGSVAQKVTRDSQVPVMVVRDCEKANEKYHGFDRILVPTDFSDPSYRALTLGIEFADFLKADLHYIHVVELPAVTNLEGASPFLQMTIPPRAGTDVDLTLQYDLKSHYFVGNPKTATLMGDPVHEILAYSEENQMDFVVMGTHGLKGLERAMLGSVTSAVIARSKIPVITVSTAGLDVNQG